MKRLKELIINNFFWKLASLIIAIALWYIVLNIEDPVKTQTVEIPLTINNAAELLNNGRMLMNTEELQNTVIYVTVRGKTKELDDNLSSKLTAAINVNLMDIYNSKEDSSSNTMEVSVSKAASSDIEIVNKRPATVTVLTEKYVEVEKEVSVNLKGSAASGYTYATESITLEPSRVTVKGPVSAVNEVKYVEIDIEIDGMSADVSVEDILPTAYTASGQETSAIVIDTAVSASAAVSKLGTLRINQPTYSGRPAEGYSVTGISWDPKTVEVMGDEDTINRLTAIDLEPSDNVEGAIESVTDTYDLRFYLVDMPINFVNRESYKLTVEYTIEKEITKTLTIPVSSLNVSGLATGAEILAESVDVTIYGVESIIEGVTDMTGFIDLAGLEAGEHEVPVNFAFPKGVVLYGETPTVTVSITESAAALLDGEGATDDGGEGEPGTESSGG